VGAELFHAGGRAVGQTDMTNPTVAFCNSANAPKKVACILTPGLIGSTTDATGNTVASMGRLNNSKNLTKKEKSPSTRFSKMCILPARSTHGGKQIGNYHIYPRIEVLKGETYGYSFLGRDPAYAGINQQMLRRNLLPLFSNLRMKTADFTTTCKFIPHYSASCPSVSWTTSSGAISANSNTYRLSATVIRLLS